MNLEPKQVAVNLMFSALGEVLKDMDSGRERLGDKPEDMKFENYDLMGFTIKRAEREGDHPNDLYFIGIKIRLPDEYPHDAYDVIKTGNDIYIKANGTMTHVFSFSKATPKALSNESLMIMMDRILHENKELLEAVEGLTMGSKYDRRKKRK